MKFSIIVPVYNVESFVVGCLNSIYQQPFSDYEVIVINDGSKDSSAELIKEFINDKPQFRFFEQENKGLSATRNIGVSLAKGEYILFLDSDDTIIENRLLELNDFLEVNPCELCLLTWENYFPDALVPVVKYNSHRHFKRMKHTTGRELLFSMLDKQPDWELFAWAMCYQRQFYIRENLSFVEGIYFEDMIFNWIALLKAQSAITFSDPFIRYLKKREGQITRDISKKNVQDRVYVSQYWVDHVGDYNFTIYEKYMFLCRISTLYFSAIILVGALKPEQREDIFEALYGPLILLNYASNALIQSLYTLVKKVGFRKTSRIIGSKAVFFFKM